EVEHAAVYCHGSCNNNCTHRCSSCNLETLANIRVNTADTGAAVIKQAVGEAQRKAQRENLTDAEVIHGNAATGEQVWVKREVKSGVPITYEEMKKN
ncbi:33748_t:CDS:2, partial [Racocetra persica]